jgi:Zn-dependent protease
LVKKMKKNTGLLVGILVILVMVPVPAVAGMFSGPVSGDPGPGIHAASLGPPVAVPVETSKIQVPIKVLTAKVTTTPPGGVLVLGSTPPGASVYIDNTLQGTTPLTLSPIPPGVHAVSFKMAGYQDYSTKVTITAGAVAKLAGTLVPVTTATVTRTISPTVPVTTLVISAGRTPVPIRTTVPDTATPTTQVTSTTAGKCITSYAGSGLMVTAPDGRLKCTIRISPVGSGALLSVPEGTLVTDAGKQTVQEIRITPVNPGEIPSGTLPDGSVWTGHAFHFLPDGTSFDPPALVSFTLNRDEWDRSDPANITLMAISAGQGAEALPTSVDPATRTFSAPAGHFSIIGLFSTGPIAGQPVPRQSLEDLVRTATGSRHGSLPLSPIIPDAIAPLAAVIAGVALSAAAVTAGGSMLVSRLWDRVLDLIGQFLGSEATGFLNTAEIEKRGVRPAENLSALVLGLSWREILVIGLSAPGFAVAFILQDRLELQLTTIIIYVCAGGVATILHDLAHKYSAYRTGCITEYQFWSIGMGTMLVTAWLFGNAFAKPSRNLIRSGKELTPEEAATIRLAGPLMSIGLAVLSLFLIPLGGLFVIAGSAGFTMNLLNGVFSLVPVAPNDGVEIYAWNKVIWACVFIPLIIFYLYIYSFL